MIGGPGGAVKSRCRRAAATFGTARPAALLDGCPQRFYDAMP